MNRTKIEYLEFTWNPIVGCSGLGCAVRLKCWAGQMAKRQRNRCELCYNFVPHVHFERFNQPLERKKPTRIGVAFMGEFYDNEIVENIRTSLYMIMEKAYWHTFIILTKQPQNIDPDEPLPKNVCIGVSVNRKKDLWRVDELRQVETSVRIVSAEPLYEELDGINLDGIGWVIIGAQTRPLLLPNYEWVLGLIQDTGLHKIPTFVKNNLEPIMARTPLLQEYPLFSVNSAYAKGDVMEVVMFVCESCGTTLQITLRSGLTIDGKVLRCPVCGSREFIFRGSKGEEEFLEKLKETPDGFAKAWGYAMYGVMKALQVRLKAKHS